MVLVQMRAPSCGGREVSFALRVDGGGVVPLLPSGGGFFHLMDGDGCTHCFYHGRQYDLAVEADGRSLQPFAVGQRLTAMQYLAATARKCHIDFGEVTAVCDVPQPFSPQ